tara:strand:+ start:280 stop:591 length:312 start_codon:yes stop_codon:yes gene_type:complete
MATFTEKTEYDKIEIVGELKGVHVRKRNLVLKDNVPISSTFERYVLNPGTLDSSDNLVDNPLTKEPDGVTDIPTEIKSVCSAVWTTPVKDSYKAFLIENKPPV